MQVSLKQYYTLLVQYLHNQKLRFTWLTLLMFSSIGLQIVNPQITRRFIDAVTAGTDLTTLWYLALAFIGVALLHQLCAVSSTYMGESVAWQATNALRADLATHCLHLDMRFHGDRSPGEFIERIETDVTEFANFFSQLVIRVVGNILLLLGILVALFFTNWQLGLAFACFAISTIFALNRVRGVAIPYQKAFRDANTQLFAFLEERLAGTEDIRSCGAVDYVLQQLFVLHTHLLHCWKKSSIMRLSIGATTGLMMCAGYGLAFVLSYHLYKTGAVTVGVAFLVVHYTSLVGRPIRQLSQQVENLQNIGATIERINELRKEKSTIVDGPGVELRAGALHLEFADVSFAYAEDKPVLQNLSFQLQPGKALGLLGRTGGGKTTMARLIFRLYDPIAGSIRLDGHDIRAAQLSQLRERIAYVTQDVQLFQASVRENVTLFDTSISDERIHEVVASLGLLRWYEGLPEGLNTRLQSGGRSLSAGEAQLLALTRVFLRNPGLVVLDEASSRLDPATEQLVEQAIDKLLAGRTAIIIAHRLATVHRCDEILIIDEGRVAEYGNRQQLLADPQSRFYNLHQTGLEELLA